MEDILSLHVSDLRLKNFHFRRGTQGLGYFPLKLQMHWSGRSCLLGPLKIERSKGYSKVSEGKTKTGILCSPLLCVSC